MISCLRSIHAWKSRNSNDKAIFTALCSIWPRVSCRGHQISFHVGSPLPKRSENTFLTIRIRIWLHSVFWRVSPPGRSLLYWTRLLNNDMVGHSWRSTSRQDRVLNQENFLYNIIFPNNIYFTFYSMEPQLPAKSNAVTSNPLTYSCYVICARPSYGGGLCMWDRGIY